MTPIVTHGHALGVALQAEGLVPANCQQVDVIMPLNGAPIIRYEVFLTVDDIGKLGRAMARAADADVGLR